MSAKTKAERIDGYLGAATVSLGIAARIAEKDPKLVKKIERIVDQVNKIREGQ